MARRREVLEAALRNAGVKPEQSVYVKRTVTGTLLGDPIEIRALSAVLNSGREKALCGRGEDDPWAS